MSRQLTLWVEGIGAWAPGVADWPAWRDLLCGQGGVDADAPARPKPARLAAGERRRISVHVLAAIEAADQAVTMSGREAANLPSVFTSMHGDAQIMDYMCAILADTPQHLSPTRFHNSVHNAGVGYWTIATGCHEASNAVASLRTSFGAGLLEAAAQALAEDHPVLLAANDEPGSGPLGEVLGTSHAFACALVLAPNASARALARIDLVLGEHFTSAPEPQHPHASAIAKGNPCGHGVILLEALAKDDPATLTLAVTPTLGLTVNVDKSVPD